MYKAEDEQIESITCIEDCPKDKQKEWINSMSLFTIQHIVLYLLDIIKMLGDKTDAKVENIENLHNQESLLNKIKKDESNK